MSSLFPSKNQGQVEEQQIGQQVVFIVNIIAFILVMEFMMSTKIPGKFPSMKRIKDINTIGRHSIKYPFSS
jgi:flagellar biogenesis protein FliO